jgi:hypothetical protein
MNRIVVRRCAEGAYTAAVVCLAVMGVVRESAAFTVLAVALTLPFGVAALVAIYGGYGLMSGIGGIWASTTRPDGTQAAWLSTGSATLNIAALCVAALADVALLEWRIRSRRPARVRG